MNTYNFENEIQHWASEDLANIATILEIEEPKAATAEQILNTIKWLYHSKTTSRIQSSILNAQKRWFDKRKQQEPEIQKDDLRSMPSYEELVKGAANKLKVYDGLANIENCESYISHAVMISALTKMTPAQRAQFFQQPIDLPNIAKDAGVGKNSMAGTASTFAALSAAQASGFGIYLASTTALGFATSAVGIALPFAAYTGMTTTIGWIIGPAGWLVAGLWGSWQLTQPEWKKLIPTVLYIINTKSKRALMDQAR